MADSLPGPMVFGCDTHRWKIVAGLALAIGVFICAVTVVYHAVSALVFMAWYPFFVGWAVFHTNTKLFYLRLDEQGMAEVEWGREKRILWPDVERFEVVGDHYDLVVGVVLVPAKRKLRMPWRKVDYVMKNNYGMTAESLIDLMTRFRDSSRVRQPELGAR